MVTILFRFASENCSVQSVEATTVMCVFVRVHVCMCVCVSVSAVLTE